MKQALGFAVFGILTLSLVAAAHHGPDQLSLDECGEKQPAVAFDHAAHGKLTACATCHHTQADLTEANAASIQVRGCSDCHVKPEAATTPGCSDMSMTKNIFHVTCVTCHKEAVKADATKKAPTKCAECHVKG